MKAVRIALASLALVFCLATISRGEELHETWLKYMAGKWKFTMGEVVGKQTTETAPGVQAVVFRSIGSDGFSIMGVIGWDNENKMLVESDFIVGNGRTVRKYTEISETAIMGYGESWENGAGTHFRIGYKRISDNEMHLVIALKQDEVVAVKFERITDK